MTQEEIEKLQEQHNFDRMTIEYLQAENKFYNEFIKYLHDRAIGDKSQIIEAVADNMQNQFIGYVKVTKSINANQKIILEFEPEKEKGKYRAEWQPSDNFACWQTCGYEGDDYSGYLLLPTYKDDEYFCMWYSC